MSRINFPFSFYDPYTDQRLDPKDESLLALDSPIPIELHHTTRQAKSLIGKMTQAEIIVIDQRCEELCAHWLEIQWPATKRDVLYNDDTERLRLALSHGKHSIPPVEWSRYMGVFALRFAGLIHCQVWPTDEYLNFKYGNSKHDGHINVKLLREHATIAARAAAYGEAFRDILIAENKYRDIFKKNGRQAHRDKDAIATKFITWALALPKDHKFRTTSKAAVHFIDNELSVDEKKTAGAASFHETLAKKLNAHCLKTGIQHPFKPT